MSSWTNVHLDSLLATIFPIVFAVGCIIVKVHKSNVNRCFLSVVNACNDLSSGFCKSKYKILAVHFPANMLRVSKC